MRASWPNVGGGDFGMTRGRSRRKSLAASVAGLLVLGSTITEAQTTRRGPQPAGRESAPVQSCPEFGAGFYRVPGSSTCVQISGRVAAEFGMGPRGGVSSFAPMRGGDTIGLSSAVRPQIDVRTPTEWGTGRTVVRMRGVAGSTPAGRH